MDWIYYIDHIRDELCGAEEYVKKAAECKAVHPEWAQMYMSMSQAEVGHAQNLIKIFEDDYKTSKEDIPIYGQMHKAVNDMYTDQAAKVKMLQQTYSER